jgi:hypothetical protein
MWDFNKNHKIKYKHLKDALSVKFFKFDPVYRNMLINLALKYIINRASCTDLDNSEINYEALCLDLI